MNVETLRFWRTPTRLLFSAAGLLVLSACAGVQSGPFPTFADIPQAPGDVRSTEGWNIAVNGTQAERAQLLAETAPSTFSLSDTQGFVAAERAAIAYDPADVPSATQAAQSAAWAAKMRERATPPPRPR